MRILLDTHTFIWFIDGNPRLSRSARQLIEDLNTIRLISIASLWEMAIKIGIGKLFVSSDFSTIIPSQLHRNVIDLLDIDIAQFDALSHLPLHHRDPFDRMLVAQAMVERIPILSADAAFDADPVQRIW